ncbi:unnamed protein product [Orchesella dallaii]|uniref:Kinase n=1 Tax=Orchesella dallaii TaxID=48710 RepID=A0ABP1QUM7_9HEXA
MRSVCKYSAKMAGKSSAVNVNLLVQPPCLSTCSTSSHGQFQKSSINGYLNGKIETKMNSNLEFGDGSEIVLVPEEDLQLFDHQVSGHGTAEKGLLKHKLGFILKPLQNPPMGTREKNFYKQVFEKNLEKPEYYNILEKFLPKFYGVAQIKSKSNNWNGNGSLAPKYLVLENIIQGFTKPCINDIKIGSQTWSPDASEAKIKQEKSKYTGTKFSLGICLTGMQYFDVQKNEKCKKSKDFGKSLDSTTVNEAVKEFFNAENSPLYRNLVKVSYEKLLEIEQVFSIQNEFKIYGSSVLIAYDAEYFLSPPKTEISSEILCNNIPLRVYLIDFAHVHPTEDEQLDENYLFGLRSLIRIFKEILEES